MNCPLWGMCVPFSLTVVLYYEGRHQLMLQQWVPSELQAYFCSRSRPRRREWNISIVDGVGGGGCL